MALQWILLALFLIAMVRNIAKALRNPMLKNILRLISILVAFIITFILQICGVFQHIIELLVGGLELASKVPEFEGLIANAIQFLLPFCTTLLSPTIFVLAFAIILLILKVVHVNLTYRFIVKRKRKKEIKALKQALKEEKQMLKQALTENEEKFLSVMNEMAANYPEMDAYEYDALDEDEIDRMVEQRIKLEKKKKKKAGFFKESSEHKAISVICGVVCGFLLFGICWMGLFYTMDVLSDVTDGINQTNAADTKIYQAVELVDKHVVTPYEESFVYKLYDSMAMIDLLNYTVRAGGKLEVNGNILYADDVMRDHMMRAVRLACEITSAKSEQTHIGEDVSAITKDPITVSLMADLIITLLDKVDTPEADASNPLSSIYGGILGNYKSEGGRDRLLTDLGAMSDIVVIAAENRLLAKIISDTSNIGALLGDRDMVKDLAAVMSHLSFFGSTMEGAFGMGVDALGAVLMPADNQAGYELLINNIVSAAGGITTISDLSSFYDFIEGAGTLEKATDNKYSGILGYIVDPFYQATQKLESTEEGSVKDRIDDLKTLISDFENKIKDLNDTINRINELNEIVENRFDELVQIELKVEESGVESLTEEEKELWDLQTELDSFESLEDYENQVSELESQKDALETTAKELENDIKQIMDEALTEVEKRFAGIEPFINYFMNWNNVQKPFMLANEDKSTACMSIIIVDENTGVETLYVCTTDFLSIETLMDFVLNDDAFGDLGGLGGSTEEPGTEEPGTEGGESGTEGGESGTEGGESGGEGGTEDSTDNIGDLIEGILDTEEIKASIEEYIDKIPMKELIEQMAVTSDTSTMEGRVSPLTDLISHIIINANADKNASTEINNEWLYSELTAYCSLENKPEDCTGLANRILLAKDSEAEGYVPFDYKGVTVEGMKASMSFGDDWTPEEREDDSEVLVDIIFNLLDLVQNMNSTKTEQVNEETGATDGGENTEGTEGTEGGENTEGTEDTEGGENTEDTGAGQVSQMLDLLKILGSTMDQMAQTHSLGNIPAILIEGILKNEMLSVAMTPSMLYGENGYMVKVQAIIDGYDAFNASEQEEYQGPTYQAFMEDLAETVTNVLGKVSGENTENNGGESTENNGENAENNGENIENNNDEEAA